MAGGTKRLPRAVREQQMLDAAVEVFARKGFHDTSMDAIAAEAKISKPMLYLYYGSKDELFARLHPARGSALHRSGRARRRPATDPHEQVRTALEGFLDFVDRNRQSWQVLYRQAIGQQAFASKSTTPASASSSSPRNCSNPAPRTPNPAPISRSSRSAVIGAGEAIADRVASGRIEVAEAVDLLDDLAWRGLAGRKKTD